MLARTTFLFLCAFLLHCPLQADPANVLVGDLTFTRPEAWTWESTGAKSNVLSRFILPDDSGNPSKTDVRFYLLPMNATDAAALWKSYFPQIKESDYAEQKKKIGKHEVTYVGLRGTQIYPGGRPKPNVAVFGAIIPSGKQFVHIRLFGPETEVEAARIPFKKMVEDALQEKEGE